MPLSEDMSVPLLATSKKFDHAASEKCEKLNPSENKFDARLAELQKMCGDRESTDTFIKEFKTQRSSQWSLDEERLPAAFSFDGSEIEGTLLHYALWKSWKRREEKAETLRLVLGVGASVDAAAFRMSPTSEPTSPPRRSEKIHAMHFAAGWNYAPGLEALAQFKVQAMFREGLRDGNVLDFTFAKLPENRKVCQPFEMLPHSNVAVLVPGNSDLSMGGDKGTVNWRTAQILRKAGHDTDGKSRHYAGVHKKLLAAASGEPRQKLVGSGEGDLDEHMKTCVESSHVWISKEDEVDGAPDTNTTAFLSIFSKARDKDGVCHKRPLKSEKNVGMVYAVAPSGDQAPAESAEERVEKECEQEVFKDHERCEAFLKDIAEMAENAVSAVIHYNKKAESVDKIQTFRVPKVSTHNNKIATTFETVCALLWGLHAGITAAVLQDQQADVPTIELIISGHNQVFQDCYDLYRRKAWVVPMLKRSCLRNGELWRPIHTAAYCGGARAVKWLLENVADPNACDSTPRYCTVRTGFTPLHWVARTGAGDVTETVNSLLEHKAQLSKTASELNHGEDTGTQDTVIPLDIAMQNNSGFPKDRVHLLAPSTQDEGRSHSGQNIASMLDDILTLSKVSRSSAELLATQVSEDEDLKAALRSQLMIRSEAFKEKSSAADVIANLLYTAPSAAGVLLNVLTVIPIVEDWNEAPLKSRANFRGWFRDSKMRCDYQPDVSDQEHDTHTVKGPCWQKEKKWHDALYRTEKCDEDDRRGSHIYDCATKVVLLPNCLDLDMLKALSVTREDSLKIFAKLPIQGMLYALWSRVMVSVVLWEWSFLIADLLVLLCWGLTPVNRPPFGRLYLQFNATCEHDCVNYATCDCTPSYAPHVCRPLLWSFLLASLIRESVDLMWAFKSHLLKWADHRHNTNTVLENLWHPSGFFKSRPFGLRLAAIVVKFWFLYFIGCHKWEFFGSGELSLDALRMDKLRTVALACLILFHSARVMYRMRVFYEIAGTLIIVTMKTIFNYTMLELFSVMFMLLISFTCCFWIVDESHGWQYVFVNLYRGLLLGDGDGLDQVDLKAEDVQIDEKHFLMTASGIFATMVLFVIFLNLMIAIFSNEYDRINKTKWLLFGQDIAEHSCLNLLSYQKLHLGRDSDKGDTRRTHMIWAKYLAVAVLCFAVVAWLAIDGLGITYDHTSGFAVSIFVAVLMAFVQMTHMTIKMQTDWFPMSFKEKTSYFTLLAAILITALGAHFGWLSSVIFSDVVHISLERGLILRFVPPELIAFMIVGVLSASKTRVYFVAVLVGGIFGPMVGFLVEREPQMSYRNWALSSATVMGLLSLAPVAFIPGKTTQERIDLIRNPVPSTWVAWRVYVGATVGVVPDLLCHFFVPTIQDEAEAQHKALIAGAVLGASTAVLLLSVLRCKAVPATVTQDLSIGVVIHLVVVGSFFGTALGVLFNTGHESHEDHGWLLDRLPLLPTGIGPFVGASLGGFLPGVADDGPEHARQIRKRIRFGIMAWAPFGLFASAISFALLAPFFASMVGLLPLLSMGLLGVFLSSPATVGPLLSQLYDFKRYEQRKRSSFVAEAVTAQGDRQLQSQRESSLGDSSEYKLNYKNKGLLDRAANSLDLVRVDLAGEVVQEGPQAPHYLWICHRADFTEDHFINEDLEKEDLENLEDRLAKQSAEQEGKISNGLRDIEQRIKKQSSDVEERLASVEERIERHVTSVEGKLDAILGMLNKEGTKSRDVVQ